MFWELAASVVGSLFGGGGGGDDKQQQQQQQQQMLSSGSSAQFAPTAAVPYRTPSVVKPPDVGVYRPSNIVAQPGAGANVAGVAGVARPNPGNPLLPAAAVPASQEPWVDEWKKSYEAWQQQQQEAVRQQTVDAHKKEAVENPFYGVGYAIGNLFGAK